MNDKRKKKVIGVGSSEGYTRNINWLKKYIQIKKSCAILSKKIEVLEVDRLEFIEVIMMEMNQKLKVLSKIAEELNSKNITWAVGGSLLLYLKGKTSFFNDIDIMVAEQDAERLKNILLQLGVLQTSSSNAQYKTKFFWEFDIDDVDVDVMGGFVIITDNKEYYFPLRRENIIEHTIINSQTIPLQSLKDWRIYYQLMGRVEKVKMIDRV